MGHSRKPGQRASKAYKARRDIIEVHGNMNKAGRNINTAQRDINFGAVSNLQDFAAQLEHLKAELVAAKEAGVLSEDEATDAEYDVTKASQQAKKDHPDKKVILEYLNNVKTLLEGVTTAAGLVPSVVSAIEAVHKLFS